MESRPFPPLPLLLLAFVLLAFVAFSQVVATLPKRPPKEKMHVKDPWQEMCESRHQAAPILAGAGKRYIDCRVLGEDVGDQPTHCNAFTYDEVSSKA